MAEKRTFPVTIKYVTNPDGDPVVLPEESEIAALETEAGEIEAQLESTRGEAVELSKDPEQAERFNAAKAALLLLAGKLEELRARVTWLKAVLAEHGPRAKRWEFTLHKYKWSTREEIGQECREINVADGSVRINQARLKLGLLAASIDKWNLKAPVSEESIDSELPPAAIDRLYDRLRKRSEASADSLPFPGARADRPDAGEPGVAGEDDLQPEDVPVDRAERSAG